MKKTIILTTMAFLISLSLVFPTFAESGKQGSQQSSQKMGAQMTQGQEDFFRTSALLNKPIKDQQGQKLGTVKDVIVSGVDRTDYLIIQPEGDNKLVPVPMDRAHAKIQGGDVVAKISKDQLKGAPSFSSNQWPNFAEDSFEQKVHAYYAPGEQKGGSMK